MDRLPKVGPMCYNFEPRELPSNSYLNLGGPYGKFVPFIICGEGGLGEHKMINWTNLFLLNKLGGHFDTETGEMLDQIKVERDIEKIKQLIKRLPSDIGKHLDGHDTDEQINIIHDLSKSMDEKALNLGREIRCLKQDMRDVKQALRDIRDAVDRIERQNPRGGYAGRQDPFCGP